MEAFESDFEEFITFPKEDSDEHTTGGRCILLLLTNSLISVLCYRSA